MNILTKNLLKQILKDSASQEKCFSKVITDVIELLMELERELYFEENPNPLNKGNGFYERMLRSVNSNLTVRVPRDRLGFFKPYLLEIMKNEAAKVERLALMLYSRGLSQRDASTILKEVLGVHMSPSKISQLVKKFEPYRLEWQNRKLHSEYLAVQIDATYFDVRRDSKVENEAVCTVIGLNKDFTREVIGIYAVPIESSSSWCEMLSDLRDRGLKHIGMVICDELSGIENAILSNFPKSYIQFCLVHKLRQLTNKVRSNAKQELIQDFKTVFDINRENDSQQQLQQRLILFINKWGQSYPTIKRSFPTQKWTHYSSYLILPIGARKMLYTTNWIERLNKEIKKVTRHVNSFPNENSMLNLVFMVCQKMNNTYQHPITAFYPIKDKILQKLCTSETQ